MRPSGSRPTSFVRRQGLKVIDNRDFLKDPVVGFMSIKLQDLLGKKTAADPIRLDKGNAYKGQLHYTAEFIPTLALEGVKFDAAGNEIQRAADAEDPEGKDVRSSEPSSISKDDEAALAAPTIVEPKNGATAQAPTNGAPPDDATNEKPEEPVGIKMEMDELLTHHAYIL
ncbi:hypothetical protein B0H12DRAFT_1233458 [Mycena haematopus]|nr:hypothetical protein B0H12DRAFT_1233458 [Mycena haematopus]